MEECLCSISHAKGGLISESFSFWLNSLKKGANLASGHLFFRWIVLRGEICYSFLEILLKAKNISVIKPPLGSTYQIHSTKKYLGYQNSSCIQFKKAECYKGYTDSGFEVKNSIHQRIKSVPLLPTTQSTSLRLMMSSTASLTTPTRSAIF